MRSDGIFGSTSIVIITVTIINIILIITVFVIITIDIRVGVPAAVVCKLAWPSPQAAAVNRSAIIITSHKYERRVTQRDFLLTLQHVCLFINIQVLGALLWLSKGCIVVMLMAPYT